MLKVLYLGGLNLNAQKQNHLKLIFPLQFFQITFYKQILHTIYCANERTTSIHLPCCFANVVAHIPFITTMFGICKYLIEFILCKCYLFWIHNRVLLTRTPDMRELLASVLSQLWQ